MSTTTVKRYIVCLPDQRAAVVAAFGSGFDIEIDDTLDRPYEFRERELSEFEKIEAELEQAETFQADPKGADTYVVPVVASDADFEMDPWATTFVVIRASKGKRGTVESTVRSLTANTTTPSASASEIKAALEEQDVDVFSVSVAEGMIKFKEEDEG